ncbi:hypothetical protein MASR2M78_00540 [Treponema sp.]
MAFVNDYDFELLVNEAKQLVIVELEKQLGDESNSSSCLCEECVLDMATFALNAVKPLYRVSLLGSLYAAHAMDEESYAATVRSAVSKAIVKVKTSPPTTKGMAWRYLLDSATPYPSLCLDKFPAICIEV